jgi:hypothetical protein
MHSLGITAGVWPKPAPTAKIKLRILDVMSASIHIGRVKLFVHGADMSSEEKRSWIYAVVAIGISAVYFVTLGRPTGPTSATGRSTGWASTSGSTS